MSYRNLSLGNINDKMNEFLSIKNFQADNIECVDLDTQNLIVNQQDVQNLYVKNLHVSLPSTEINVVDKISLQNVNQDNLENRFLVLDSINNEIKFRNVSSLPVNNPFNQELNSNDKVVFETVLSNQYEMKNVIKQTSNYRIRNVTIPEDVDTLLKDFEELNSSDRVKFDIENGIFYPDEGLYTITYSANITSIQPDATKIGMRIQDDLGETVYSNVQDVNGLFTNETRFGTSQFENLVWYFNPDRSYTFHCKLDFKEDVIILINISRIF